MASSAPDRGSRPAAVREAAPSDIDAIRAILAEHGEDTPPAPGRPDVIGPYVRHLIDHHRVLVSVEDGVVAGFGAVVDTGRCLMLSDLFVRRDRLGSGHGRRLLERLFGSAANRATFASSDPRALPLYVRAGMTPWWAVLYVDGPAARLPDAPPGVVTRESGPAACADLERAWTGAGRRVDHQFLGGLATADAFVVERDGVPVAFGYARDRGVAPGRVLERLVVRPGQDPVVPILAGMTRAGRGDHLEACVPGPNPVLPVLLDAGFRVIDRDQFMATDRDLVDPARLLPNGGLL